MSKFNKFKKKVNEKVAKLRAGYQITKQAISEIKGARSVESLLAKHMVRGKCSVCGKTTDLIRTVRQCFNCSVKAKGWRKKFDKYSVPGLCVSCGVNDLVSKKDSLCFNCQIKRGLK